MFKINVNGVSVECGSAVEAAQLVGQLNVVSGPSKAGKEAIETVSKVSVTRVAKKSGGYRIKKVARWATNELKFIFDNRGNSSKFFMTNQFLKQRHTPKAISMMVWKIRGNQLKDMSKEAANYVKSLYASAPESASVPSSFTEVKRSLLDPVDEVRVG